MSETTNENATGQIYGLMALILADIQSVGKGRRNEQQGYSFRGVDDVYNMVHPLMSKHHVFCLPRMLAQEISERTTTGGSTLRFVQLSMAYDFFAPDGSHVTAEVIGEAMDAGDKASNKAMSAAHKYALLQTFCIPTGDVPDADYTTQPDITGERKQVSKSSTAPQRCPDCGGAMWDNRETKKGKQPDYKCRDKACGKAVWLNDERADTSVDVGRKLLVQSVADSFKVLNQAGDSITWTKKTAEEFVAENFDGETVDGLDEADLGKLLKILSNRLASLKSDRQPAPARQGDARKEADNAGETERMKKIFDILEQADDGQLQSLLAETFGGRRLDELSLDAVTAVHEQFVVPF